MRAAKDLETKNAESIIAAYLNFRKPYDDKIRELWDKLKAGKIPPYHYFSYDSYYSKQIESSEQRKKFLEIVPLDGDNEDYQRAFTEIFNETSYKIFSFPKV